ncbi:MAG TPA: metal-dependent hydrolase [Chloroflexota bacterium]|nr:metal-dependent hydrolase [Chloroflexota bacterium]
MTSPDAVTVTWLGHGTTLVESPSGKRILIDPFLTDNPATPPDLKAPRDIDLMLITHGHSDHIADAVPTAQREHPDVIAIFELTDYLGRKGVQSLNGMNKGGTVHWNDVSITMVQAVHSAGIAGDTGIIDGGSAAGFVLRFENGFTLYVAGDTAAFEDMKLIGRLYRPDAAILPIGDHFTMGPREAAEAIRMLSVPNVIPVHYGTWPLLTGTPEALEREAKDVEGLRVFGIRPGESVDQRQLV